MLHFEIVPGWMLSAIVGFAILFAILVVGLSVWSRLRSWRARARRAERRRKNLAHQQAWDWIMRRDRRPRITDARRP